MLVRMEADRHGRGCRGDPAEREAEPISDKPPYGAMTVVYRRGAGRLEYLLLHRPYGAEYEGDWVWGPPAGGRFPGEDVDLCPAVRVLPTKVRTCLMDAAQEVDAERP